MYTVCMCIYMLHNASVFYSAMYVDVIFTRIFQYLNKLSLLYKTVTRGKSSILT